MVQESSFAYDDKINFFCLDTGRIITGNNLEYLLAIFNSKLFFYSIKKYYGGGGLGETGVRMKHTFFEQFHCVQLKLFEQKVFTDIVVRIINMNQEDIKDELTQNLDDLIYKLYNLNKDEIEFIESQ